MSNEANKALVRRALEEGFNSRNFDVMDEVFLPEYVRHEAGSPGVTSLAEHKADLADRVAAFPDSRFELQEIVADGDLVAARYYITGTHLHPYRGAQPTGKPGTRACSAFFRIQDGKIAEGWLVIGRHDSFWA